MKFDQIGHSPKNRTKEDSTKDTSYSEMHTEATPLGRSWDFVIVSGKSKLKRFINYLKSRFGFELFAAINKLLYNHI